ncbi:hypothetical protein MXB_2340 [Myxobolus squamalis]|nr:hypothetical protein MXB_2340 [Myxobolus squamalis]
MFIVENIDDQTKKYSLICKLSNSSPSHFIEFTTDELFFATANVVWYSMERTWTISDNSKYLGKFCSNEFQKIATYQNFIFVYLPHPCPITSISWRRKNK